MPDMKRNFTKGKMNKDLDERLVPKGEYRDAMNIQVSTSEGSDVGTIQNVLGNTEGCVYTDPINFPNPIPALSSTVGSISDEKNDSLYWLVAGPSDITPYLPLGQNQTVSLKDLIMRTSPLSPSSCEPVFVDKHTWCVGITQDGNQANSIPFSDPTWFDSVTAGMNLTIYDATGSPVSGPTLVNSVGSLNTLAPIVYQSGSLGVSYVPAPIVYSGGSDVYIRSWDETGCLGGAVPPPNIFDDTSPCSLTNPNILNQGNLPPNDATCITPGCESVQFYILPSDWIGGVAGITVGSVISNVINPSSGANILNGMPSATITNITLGTICNDGQSWYPGAGGGCFSAYIMTIDMPVWPPSLDPQGAPPVYAGEASSYKSFDAIITPPPYQVYSPNSTIHIMSAYSSQWMDEVYNILYDASGVLIPGAELQINNSYSGGNSWPPNSCIDPASVIDDASFNLVSTPPVYDSEFEIVGCQFLANGNANPNAGLAVIPLNSNPHNHPLSFITAPQFGIQAVFLNDTVSWDSGDTMCFASERVLEFEPETLITGINILDDMLFWTDNFTEPKKINIPRSVIGTDSLGDTHTAVVNDATGLSLVNYNPIRKEHITVIRKSPKNALHLELSQGRDSGLNYSGITHTSVTQQDHPGNINASSIISCSNPTVLYDFSTLQVGDTLQFEIETDVDSQEPFSLAWNVGDTLLLKEFNITTGTAPPIPLANHTIKAIIKPWQHNSFENDPSLQDLGVVYGNQWNGGQSPSSKPGTAHVEVEVISLRGVPPQADPNIDPQLDYIVDLETIEDAIFEDKFPRFSYRYKYEDGEYSTFAPWSEIAFIPAHFNYEAKKGWNTGMINYAQSIKFKGFVPSSFGQPLGQDVTEVDILYKEEGAPNVYVVETISPLDISPAGTPNGWYAGGGIGEYEITSETIKHTLASNQLLRPWDAVPKKALAQDVSGSRIVYANYEQNFDLMVAGLKFKPEFKNYLSSWTQGKAGSVEKSIKSLRDYKLGVVFTDEYGRETPILISKSGGFKVGKKLSKSANRLVTGLEGSPPPSMAFFKFFIKETSTEYYNLAMDRWYNAEDGNIWIAFPSTDRNKVDLDTSLYFKKGGDEAIENTTRYKILDIENEAPEFIKTRRIRIGTAKQDVANGIQLFGTAGAGLELDDAPRVEGISFTMHWATALGGTGFAFGNTSLSKLDEIKDPLYIQFVTPNNYSAQYLISEITSDRENASTDGAGGVIGGAANVTKYLVTLDTNLKSEMDFIYDTPEPNASLIIDNTKIVFTKAVVENKPIFEGRFFAKIENDGKIKTQITDDSIGVNYIEKARQSVFVLDTDNLLRTTQANAIFTFPTSLSYNGTSPWYTSTTQLTTFDHTSFVNSNYNQPGDTNPGGINFNTYFARQSYFGFAAYDYSGEEDNSDNNGGALIYPDIIGGTHVNIHMSGIWFIDKSTHKYTNRAITGNQFAPNRNLFWHSGDNTNHFSPKMNNPSDPPYNWTETNRVGQGIINSGNEDESTLNLSFGGFRGWKSADDKLPGVEYSTSTDSDPYKLRLYIPNAFSVGEEGIGHHSSPNDVKFCNGLTAGSMFKWELDPSATVYTFFDQDTHITYARFGRHDMAYNVSGVSVMHPWMHMNMSGGYHKNWNISATPSMANWDPAGNIGSYMPGGLHLQDIELLAHDIDLDLNSSPSGGSQDRTINTITVDTLRSTCVNNTAFATYQLHEGMMLTNYNNNALGTDLTNVIVKKIGPFDATLGPNSAGIMGGRVIELGGYIEPLHYSGTMDLGPNAGLAAMIDSAPATPQKLEFRQVTMNGASNYTEHNTDYYKNYWVDVNGVVGNCGAMAAVGYDMLMVDPVDEFGDGGNLPPDPFVWETEPKDNTGLDIYYEISDNNPVSLNSDTTPTAIPIGSRIEGPPYVGSGWVTTVVTGNVSASGDTITFADDQGLGAWIGLNPFGPLPGGNYIQPLTSGAKLKITKPNGITFEVTVLQVVPKLGFPDVTNEVVLLKQIYNSDYHLNWHNCYSFGNGVESNRIKDNYNLPFILNGIKASTTLGEEYKQERRKYGLIYSGLYNSTSGVNNLNQFIAAEKITKDINPIYGSIQRIKAGWGAGGDLIALCEDRILKILADKDALFNADGNTNVTATNRVLGTATPYSGEYGISTNPESFASEAYRAYFTDKVRGAVMRLSKDGLTSISDAGMKDWFRDNLKLNNELIGSYDDKKDEYNISLPTTTEGISKTASFREDVKGWVSFKSFITRNGVSCANEYYTFKDANLWKHHHDVSGNRNTFYNIPTSSTFNVLLNDAPGSVKSFYTLNYEGSDSRVIMNVGDDQYYNLTSSPGWYVDNIFTNKESGEIDEFIEKEGKWFNYLRGKNIPYTLGSNVILNPDGDSLFDQGSFAIQGLGAIGGVPSPITVYGCTNPLALNYSIVANVDDGSCIMPPPVGGCMLSTASNYNSNATFDIGQCTWHGCTDPLAINFVLWPGEAQTYVANVGYGIIDDGSCGGYIFGCTDINAQNYDPTATVDDGSCIPHVLGCLGVQDVLGNVLIAATVATNYNPLATQDDGSCIWSYCSNPFDANGDAINAGFIAANVSQWTTYIFTSGYYIATDCISGGCLADFSAVNYGCFSGNINYPCSDAVAYDDGSCLGPISGCTNVIACNYNPAATLDDGSCILPDGCTDATASNYDATALCDDGTCIPCAYGCTDPTASNYDATATCDNGFCIYPVPGCMDAAVSNYNPLATVDDGSCCVDGCTDPANANYNPNATCNDTSCAPSVAGCMDPPAINYNPTVTVDDGSCLYVPGCTDATALNYNPLADTDDGSCLYSPGCMDATANNYDANADFDDGSCTYDVYGCIDATALNYDPTATIDDGSCTYDVYGCTNPSACNYDPNATIDDASCLTIYGCTDPTDANYDATAECDDGTCAAYSGCLDCASANFDPFATQSCGGSCYLLNCLDFVGCMDASAINARINTGNVTTNYVGGYVGPSWVSWDAATIDDGSCLYGGSDCWFFDNQDSEVQPESINGAYDGYVEVCFGPNAPGGMGSTGTWNGVSPPSQFYTATIHHAFHVTDTVPDPMCGLTPIQVVQSDYNYWLTTLSWVNGCVRFENLTAGIYEVNVVWNWGDAQDGCPVHPREQYRVY